MLIDEQQLNIQVDGVRQQDNLLLLQSDTAMVDQCLVLLDPKPQLKQQDRIISINGTKFSTTQELMELLHKYGQGPFELTVARRTSEEDTTQQKQIWEIKKQGQNLVALELVENEEMGKVWIFFASDDMRAEASIPTSLQIMRINDQQIESIKDVKEAATKTGKLDIRIQRHAATKEHNSEMAEMIKKQRDRLQLKLMENKEKGEVFMFAVFDQGSERPQQVCIQIINVDGRKPRSIEDFELWTEDEDESVVLKVRANRHEAEIVTVEMCKEPEQVLGMGCQQNIYNEVYISSLSALVKDSQFQVGDKLLTVNGSMIESLKDMRQAVAGASKLIIRVGRWNKVKPKEEHMETTGSTTVENGQENIEEVQVVLNCDEEEQIGVYPDENLKITRLQPGSIGAENFQMEDVIKKVNDHAVTDVNDFFNLIKRSPRPLQVIVNRWNNGEKEEKMKNQLAQNLRVQHDNEFECITVAVDFDMKAGRHFGLSLANCAHNDILVTGLRDNSVSADHFKIFDRIVEINGMPVTDANVAKSYICAAGGKFQAVIERPTSSTTRAELKRMYERFKATRMNRRNENELPVDVQEIGAIESERRRQNNLMPTQSVLKQTDTESYGEGRTLSWQESHTEIEIQSDLPEGIRLRPCH